MKKRPEKKQPVETAVAVPTLQTIVPKPTKKAVVLAMIEVEWRRQQKAYDDECARHQAEYKAIEDQARIYAENNLDAKDLARAEIVENYNEVPFIRAYLKIKMPGNLVNLLKKNESDRTNRLRPCYKTIVRDINELATGKRFASVPEQVSTLLKNPAIVTQLEELLDVSKKTKQLQITGGSK